MNTIVIYKRDGVKYSHTFPNRLPHDVAEQQMIMHLHVGRSQIERIYYQ